MASTMALAKGWKRILRLLLPLAFWLGVWQLAGWLVERSVAGRGNELLLPYPVTVLKALSRLVITGAFWRSVGASLLRIFGGLAAGVVVGSTLAALTGACRTAHWLLAPAIRVVRATPVASFILLVLLWTSRDAVPVIVSALMVVPVVWETMSQGIAATDGKLLEMARSYRFSRWKTIRLIYLPSIKPYFSAALINAVGLAWKSGSAAEVLCVPKQAIGSRIYQAKLYLEIPELFAWTVTVVCLSSLLEKGLALALRSQKGGGLT